MIRKTIFVYTEPFTETGSLYYSLLMSPLEGRGIRVEKITTDFITSGEIIRHPDSVLVLPGSADGDGYRANLAGTGFKQITNYLTNGGHSLHLCASAYLAYQSYGYREKRYQSTSFIFDGHAHGPVDELLRPNQPWRPLNNTHDIAHLIHTLPDGTEQISVSAYSSGPRLPETPKSHVIARFRDAQDQTPAILTKKVGKGLCLASSVALEINGAFTVDRMDDSTPQLSAMRAYAAALAAHEPARSALWSDIWQTYLLPKEVDLSALAPAPETGYA